MRTFWPPPNARHAQASAHAYAHARRKNYTTTHLQLPTHTRAHTLLHTLIHIRTDTCTHTYGDAHTYLPTPTRSHTNRNIRRRNIVCRPHSMCTSQIARSVVYIVVVMLGMLHLLLGRCVDKEQAFTSLCKTCTMAQETCSRYTEQIA